MLQLLFFKGLYSFIICLEIYLDLLGVHSLANASRARQFNP